MRRLLLVAVLTCWPALAVGQASIFGIRGPGIPRHGFSTRAVGSAGAFSLFDPESSIGPASLGFAPSITGTITVADDFRSTSTPAGDADVRSVRFPQAMIAVPIRTTPFVVSLSVSSYTDRDFTIATIDTLSILGNEVEVIDTLSSRGGLSDLRFALAWRVSQQSNLGFGFHFVTGVSRERLGRRFSDSTFLPVIQQAELAASGVGLSLGGSQQLGRRLAVSGMVRKDFRASLELDSADVGSFALPWHFAAGVRAALTRRLDVGAQALYQAWSSADSLLQANGGAGATSALNLSVGAEYTTTAGRPGMVPVRLGARYATLPFLTEPDAQPTEFAVSGGTGIRFARERGGLDFSVERYWRRDDRGRTEGGWLLYFGASIRP
ncbi:MAG: hypothetical protein MUC69_02700 [Gemmatimonadales bacterium]|nr:hypothetical protein [Gemmatimonadales bacterium]